MDRKIGLPPSGSTMGNNALRIKNKLFAASTMTNLRPSSSAQNSAARSGFISRRERADAAHIITLNRQNTLRGVNAFGTKVLIATRQQRLPGIPARAPYQRAVPAPNHASRRPYHQRASALRPVKRSCLSLPTDAARRKSVQTRCEQLTLRYFLPGPPRARRLAHTPAGRLQRAWQPRAGRQRQLPLVARPRVHLSRQVSERFCERF